MPKYPLKYKLPVQISEAKLCSHPFPPYITPIIPQFTHNFVVIVLEAG